MNKKLSRVFALLLSVSMLAAVLAGCGSSGNASAPAASGSQPAASQPAAPGPRLLCRCT